MTAASTTIFERMSALAREPGASRDLFPCCLDKESDLLFAMSQWPGNPTLD